MVRRAGYRPFPVPGPPPPGRSLSLGHRGGSVAGRTSLPLHRLRGHFVSAAIARTVTSQRRQTSCIRAGPGRGLRGGVGGFAAAAGGGGFFPSHRAPQAQVWNRMRDRSTCSAGSLHLLHLNAVVCLSRGAPHFAHASAKICLVRQLVHHIRMSGAIAVLLSGDGDEFVAGLAVADGSGAETLSELTVLLEHRHTVGRYQRVSHPAGVEQHRLDT